MIKRIAKTEDFDELVNIRIRAMKPSLEKIGRFDKTRATERFRKSFLPELTTVFVEDEKILGFYMLTIEKDRIFLNHLYIDVIYQGCGIGTNLLNEIKEIARKKNMVIELEALKESPSNSFYLSNGFIKIGESDFDNAYQWNC